MPSDFPSVSPSLPPPEPLPSGDREWLLTNQQGSFSMGCVDRRPRRKYHGLLVSRGASLPEPLHVLADVGERLTVGINSYLLHSLDFENTIDPQGDQHLIGFSPNAEGPNTATWIYQCGEARLNRTLRLDPERNRISITYVLENTDSTVTLAIIPLLTCRLWHHLSTKNPFLNGGTTATESGTFVFEPYAQSQFVLSMQGASYQANGYWIEGVSYALEKDRGYPYREDVFVPGELQCTLKVGQVHTLHLTLDEPAETTATSNPPKTRRAHTLRDALSLACEQFLIDDGGQSSIIAGYPWFGEWGRDTLIALPGACLRTGHSDLAVRILDHYASARVRGLIPNILGSDASQTNTDSVDASLWFITALQSVRQFGLERETAHLMPVACEILEALAAGADPRVQVDAHCGVQIKEGPWALTWMDAKIGDQPVTPRHGYPVDINALFYNAVMFALHWARQQNSEFFRVWSGRVERASELFIARFWSESAGFLADTVSSQGEQNTQLRPNQLWALALPHRPKLSQAKQEQILDQITEHLLTPVGLRTLAPFDARYVGVYQGDQTQRDHAYHQGTVWPWLIGVYADAMRATFGLDRTRDTVRPILRQLGQHLAKEACLGQVSEIFDGDAPHTPRGAPAQAWSTAELLRVLDMLGQ